MPHHRRPPPRTPGSSRLSRLRTPAGLVRLLIVVLAVPAVLLATAVSLLLACVLVPALVLYKAAHALLRAGAGPERGSPHLIA